MEQNRILKLCCRHPHPTTRTMLLEMDLVQSAKISAWIAGQSLEFFLCVFCNSGCACPTMGLGLRNRNPNVRNRRWHCRVPRFTPHCCLIQWLRVFPSQRFFNPMRCAIIYDALFSKQARRARSFLFVGHVLRNSHCPIEEPAMRL
jgi:hypothetical protein